jgi:hypothetical protein
MMGSHLHHEPSPLHHEPPHFRYEPPHLYHEPSDLYHEPFHIRHEQSLLNHETFLIYGLGLILTIISYSSDINSSLILCNKPSLIHSWDFTLCNHPFLINSSPYPLYNKPFLIHSWDLLSTVSHFSSIVSLTLSKTKPFSSMLG